jgi:hypothetical protein
VKQATRFAAAIRAVIALSALAAIVFAVVVVEEVTYASDHPYAYGPAKIIAWGAGAGVLLSIAVAFSPIRSVAPAGSQSQAGLRARRGVTALQARCGRRSTPTVPDRPGLRASA